MSTSTYSGITIAGVGHHLPELAEDNETLCRGLDVTPEWILEKTGIEQRYIAAADDSAADFAVKACQRALEMNGIATWKQAITHLPKVIRKACEKSGVELASVDFLLFHQANLRMIEYIVRKMGFDMSKTYTNVQRVGNSGSASLAIVLSQAVGKSLLKDGDLVVLAAVGAGFNFGASVWRWHMPARKDA